MKVTEIRAILFGLAEIQYWIEPLQRQDAPIQSIMFEIQCAISRDANEANSIQDSRAWVQDKGLSILPAIRTVQDATTLTQWVLPDRLPIEAPEPEENLWLESNWTWKFWRLIGERGSTSSPIPPHRRTVKGGPNFGPMRGIGPFAGTNQPRRSRRSVPHNMCYLSVAHLWPDCGRRKLQRTKSRW